jgi:uncharacterized membrane protein
VLSDPEPVEEVLLEDLAGVDRRVELVSHGAPCVVVLDDHILESGVGPDVPHGVNIARR